MDPNVTIPRQALAELLAACGSNLTPEEYVAALPVNDTLKKYPSRARAAAWSKPVLLIIAVFSVVLLPFNQDIEDVVIVIGLCTVTFFEYRVHRYFREGDPRAPGLGFRNQAVFAAAILAYGLCHAFVPSQVEVPAEYREVMDPAMAGSIQAMQKVFYLIVGIVGGLSQFALACYYRSAATKN